MPACPMTVTSRDFPLAAGRVEQVLEQPQLVVAPDERRLERARSAAAAAPRHHGSARQAGTGAGLALERLLPGRLEGDRVAGGPIGRLAHQHRARLAPPTGVGWRC